MVSIQVMLFLSNRELIGYQFLKKEEVDRQVQKILDQNIIFPSGRPWDSPTVHVLVEMKDGAMRVCIDYRKMNLVTMKDAYPLLRIDDSLDILAGSQYFYPIFSFWLLAARAGRRSKRETCFHYWPRALPF